MEGTRVPYVDVDDLRTFYDESGDSAAIPLVLLHGGMGMASDLN
jgi:pimeloyl-ACP methyl ester carboxylesterase